MKFNIGIKLFLGFFIEMAAKYPSALLGDQSGLA